MIPREYSNRKKMIARPRFLSPFEMLASMDYIHNIFHVLSLHKYVGDPSHVLRTKKFELTKNLVYEDNRQGYWMGKRECSKTSRFPWSKSSRRIRYAKRLLSRSSKTREIVIRLLELNFRDKILNKERRNVRLLSIL